MTINIDIYCLLKPTVSDLTPLHLKEGKQSEDVLQYAWVPEPDGNRILITINKKLKIASTTFDKICIDEHIAVWKSAGIDIPEEFLQKISRDDNYSSGKLHVFKVEGKGTGLDNPTTGKPTQDETYTIRADRELYKLATQYPLLAGVDPQFKFPFGLCLFTQGKPTYEVNLEAKVTASQKTIEQLANLASYFSKAFKGTIYDPDNDKFGIPDAAALYQNGMQLFFDVAKDANKQGAKVKPLDF